MFAGGGRYVLLQKTYSMGESADIERDVYEAMNWNRNPAAIPIKNDNSKGELIITVTYKSTEACDCQGFHHNLECKHHQMCY